MRWRRRVERAFMWDVAPALNSCDKASPIGERRLKIEGLEKVRECCGAGTRSGTGHGARQKPG